MSASSAITAQLALSRLREGNDKYIESKKPDGDISPEIRYRTAREGQAPYAVIITCSDSRVIPECIFSAGIGELFVIRVAGNVVGEHELGSVEYAVDHLGCRLVVVLGHTHCGAVGAAISHPQEGFVKSITDEISAAIGGEKDDRAASELNVRHSVAVIMQSIGGALDKTGCRAVGAVYDIESGKVDFI